MRGEPDVRHQGRGARSTGGDLCVPRAEDDVWGQADRAGDTVFIFASENEGGPGLIARGVVTSAEATARKPGVARQTPRVSVVLKRTAVAQRRVGRRELKSFSEWDDGRPETELNFKLYRQATNKVAGIPAAAAAFLQRFFKPVASGPAPARVRA